MYRLAHEGFTQVYAAVALAALARDDAEARPQLLTIVTKDAMWHSH